MDLRSQHPDFGPVRLQAELQNSGIDPSSHQGIQNVLVCHHLKRLERSKEKRILPICLPEADPCPLKTCPTKIGRRVGRRAPLAEKKNQTHAQTRQHQKRRKDTLWTDFLCSQ